MQEDPYFSILETIRGDQRERARPAFRLGEVKSVSPLLVETGGQVYGGERLFCNAQLLPNPEGVALTELFGNLSGTVDCGAGAVSGMAVAGGALTARGAFGGVLSPGDRVVLLCDTEEQAFFILCKVVEVD